MTNEEEEEEEQNLDMNFFENVHGMCFIKKKLRVIHTQHHIRLPAVGTLKDTLKL
jgi:hypothetical protein